MDLAKLTLNELQQGWHTTPQGLACNYCQAVWSNETSLDQLQNHLDLVHGGNQSQLLHLKSRYNTLTVKQQDLLTAFAAGIKDQALAEQLQVAPATVRHQKFTFREKAKQAKFYLAVYETVFKTVVRPNVPASSPTTTASTETTHASEDETASALQAYFNFDQETVRLKRWPSNPKIMDIILKRILTEIPLNVRLSETTLNNYLKPIYFDYVTLRRQLIANGFLTQSADGLQYWRTNPESSATLL